MGNAIRNIDEMLVVSTSSGRAVLERVMIAFREIESCAIAQPSEEVVHIAETTKRLLSRKTSICVVTLVNEPRRLLAHISGELREDRIVALKAAIYGSSVDRLRGMEESGTDEGKSLPKTSPNDVAKQPWSGVQIAVPPAPFEGASVQRPVPQPSFVDSGRTELRPTHRAESAVTGHTPPGQPKLQLQVSDGRSFELGAIALIGRNPAATTEDIGALLVALADDGVSKTHVAIGRQGDDAWVEDRRSTNGTILIDQFGRELVLIPGQRMIFQPPARLQLGDTSVTVVRV